MPDRELATFKDLIYYQNARPIAKSAFAAATAQARPTWVTWTGIA